MRFRRTLNRKLPPLGVSFAEWRLREATRRLVRVNGDAVSQQDVARELDLDESSVSRLMSRLSLRGLLSHDLDRWGLYLRVLSTTKTDRVVAAGYELAAKVAEDAPLAVAPCVVPEEAR